MKTAVSTCASRQLNSRWTAAGIRHQLMHVALMRRTSVHFPTREGDVSEVIGIDVLHLLNLRRSLSQNVSHHLANQQNGVVVSGYVVVHLQKRDSLPSLPECRHVGGGSIIRCSRVPALITGCDDLYLLVQKN